MPELVTSIAILAALGAAVWLDVRLHRIPNWLTLGAFAAGVALQTTVDGGQGLLRSFAGTGVGLACFLPLYLGKGTGAGDVKLIGAVGAFLGPAGALLAAALTLVCGAVMALALVAWRLVRPHPMASCIAATSETLAATTPVSIAGIRQERFPYAVAIALGTVTTLWTRGTLDGAMHAMGLA